IFLGMSFAFLGVSIFQKFPKIGAKIGALLLIIASIGNFIAGVFNTDPIATSPDNMSMSGVIHSVAASMLGLMIVSTIFITILYYTQNALKPYKRSMLIITVLLWGSELILVGAMG